MNTYTCENCGHSYEKGWGDEEAKAESQSNWGNMPAEDLAVVCDGCHKEMMGQHQQMTQRAVEIKMATTFENRALVTENPFWLGVALKIRAGKGLSDAIREQTIESFVESFVKSINIAKTADCLRSPKTGHSYKNRIMKKKLSRGG